MIIKKENLLIEAFFFDYMLYLKDMKPYLNTNTLLSRGENSFSPGS